MTKPAFLSPGSVVRTTGAINPSERNATGFVRRRPGIGEDAVTVTLLDGPYKGYNLSYRAESLSPVE